MKEYIKSLPISKWLADGGDRGYTHLLVVLNARANNYEPIYATSAEDLEIKKKTFSTGWYSVLTDCKIG